MTPRAILRAVEEAIGPRAWADGASRWERNVARDKEAVETALALLKVRMKKTRTDPVRNRDCWLEAVFRTHEGKAVQA
jgi:hypothetical protein